MNNNQDKSYERKLQSLSSGFELKPAADSWNKIEAQLLVKKKRRFLFFLIPVGIVMLVAGVFVFSNNEVIEGSNNIQVGHLERSRRSATSVSNNSTNNSNQQRNGIGSEVNAKTSNKIFSDQSSENKNGSAIAATGNTFSSSGISGKSHQNKNQKSHSYNNASSNVTEIKNKEQLNSESSIAIKVNETENEELIRMTLLDPALMASNNLSPVGINFQQTLQTKKSSRWSVGLTYLPMLTNRKVSYDLQNSNPLFFDDTSNKRKDEYLFVNNFGLDVYCNISKKFYLHAGIYSVTYGEKIFYDNKVYQNITSVVPFTALNYADYIAPGSGQEHTNKYQFIQVPFNIGARIRTGSKTSLNIEPGFAYGYLLKAEALQYLSINDSLKLYALDNAELTNMNRHIFFTNASISFDWRLIKNISWRNGFMAQYQLTDLYKKEEIQSQHNYRFGLNTSLIFHFK